MNWVEQTNWNPTYPEAMEIIINQDEVDAAYEAKEYWERHPDFGVDERSY
jgi:hypothetical protein